MVCGGRERASLESIAGSKNMRNRARRRAWQNESFPAARQRYRSAAHNERQTTKNDSDKTTYPAERERERGRERETRAIELNDIRRAARGHLSIRPLLVRESATQGRVGRVAKLTGRTLRIRQSPASTFEIPMPLLIASADTFQ